MLHSLVAVESELSRLDVNQSTLCALTGIAAGSLSDILRGVKKCQFEQEQAIYRALEGLDRLTKAAAPLQLDFKKTLQLREQIALLDAGRLQISIVVQEERPRTIGPQYLVFLGNVYFVRRAKNVLGKFEIAGANQSSGATRVSKECGDRLVSALSGIGYRAQLVKSTSTSEDGACDDFAAIWGEPQPVKQ
jgi:hypothetical protein